MVLDADIASVDGGELFFRGRRARELAAAYDYEAVAAWLWGAELEPHRRFSSDAPGVGHARRSLAALPPSATTLDRIQAAVIALGAADPLRYDPAPESLARVGAEVIAGVAAVLSDHDTAATSDEPSIAETLWSALARRRGTDAEVRALNGALVLVIDHDLAISTLAARAAASARASGYAVVTSALGALDSALHGNASRAAAELIARVLGGHGADAALADAVVRGGRGVPGFGHSLYPAIDPRAQALFELIGDLEGAESVLAAVDELSRAVSHRAGQYPNVDLALAALVTAASMPLDAGAAIFAIGRMGGWVAHAIDEYGERPLRLRPRGRYVGP